MIGSLAGVSNYKTVNLTTNPNDKNENLPIHSVKIGSIPSQQSTTTDYTQEISLGKDRTTPRSYNKENESDKMFAVKEVTMEPSPTQTPSSAALLRTRSDETTIHALEKAASSIDLGVGYQCKSRVCSSITFHT